MTKALSILALVCIMIVPGATVSAAGHGNAARSTLADSGNPIFGTESVLFTGVVATASTACSKLTSATIGWGDGSAPSSATLTAGGSSCSLSGSHTYNEEGIYTVTVTVTPSPASGTPEVIQTTATIGDTLLSSTGAFITATAGALFTGVVGTVSDSDPLGTMSDFTVSVDWGDGTPPSPGSVRPNTAGGFDVIAFHNYLIAGLYFAKVTVIDIGGAESTSTDTVIVGHPVATAGMQVRGLQTAGSMSLHLTALADSPQSVSGTFLFTAGGTLLGHPDILSLVCTGKHSGYLYGNGFFDYDTPVTFVIMFTGNQNARVNFRPDSYRVIVSNGYDSGTIGGAYIRERGC